MFCKLLNAGLGDSNNMRLCTAGGTSGREIIKAIMHSGRPILFAGFLVRMEDTKRERRLPTCLKFRQLTGGGRGLRGGGQGKERRVDGVFPGGPQCFRYQRRPVDDCSPGRGGMAQDGGTRGGVFHGEIDRYRESQG